MIFVCLVYLVVRRLLDMKLIYELSSKGRGGVRIPEDKISADEMVPSELLRNELAELPEVSESEVVRHYTRLSRLNYSVDTEFYPLGSCTMKHNPRACEAAASMPELCETHPLWPQLRHGGLLTQGSLQILYNTERLLSEITDLAEFTLQPLAGSHGELTAVMMMAAYHRDRGNKKTHIIIPDSAHGTNPASAALGGYDVVTVPSDENGVMDLEKFKEALNDETAGAMLTLPNTLGVFNPQIKELIEAVHAVDGLMYYDGANFNAIMGRIKPGNLGFDICHLNLHKSFSTPHGGGGPGSGPVGVGEKLRPYLPISRVGKTKDGLYTLDYEHPKSIGYIAPFYGNFSIRVTARCSTPTICSKNCAVPSRQFRKAVACMNVCLAVKRWGKVFIRSTSPKRYSIAACMRRRFTSRSTCPKRL